MTSEINGLLIVTKIVASPEEMIVAILFANETQEFASINSLSLSIKAGAKASVKGL